MYKRSTLVTPLKMADWIRPIVYKPVQDSLFLDAAQGRSNVLANKYLLSRRKRVLDLTVATTAFVFLVPFLLVVGLIIKLTSPGPVLVRQTRHGRGRTEFVALKLRSMYYTTAPDIIARQASYGDPRVTAFGRMIRRRSIDELPQLLNVIRGEMSSGGSKATLGLSR